MLATLAQSTSLGTGIDVWNFFTKGSGQIDLMVLLLHEDLANLLSHRIFPKRFTLWNAIAVITNGFIFIVEIIAEHVSRVFRSADRLRTNHRHFAEVIDLPREDQGMIELLLGVNFELSGDVHIFRAREFRRFDPFLPA